MSINISEYAVRPHDMNGTLDLLGRPSMVHEALEFGLHSQPFAHPIQRIVVAVDCRVLVYEGPGETSADPDGADGASEFWPAGEYVRAFPVGYKLTAAAL